MYVQFLGIFFHSQVLYSPVPEYQQHLCSSEAIPIEEARGISLGFLCSWLHDIRSRHFRFTHAQWSRSTGVMLYLRFLQPPYCAVTD
jgi:hypothetical protein